MAAVVLWWPSRVLRSQWGDLLGSAKTHHIVLLDDSFSMSDRWGDTDAFAQAKKVVERIGAAAAREKRPQTFTLLRFSRVGRPGAATQPDLAKEPVGGDFPAKLAEKLKAIEVSQTAAEPAAGAGGARTSCWRGRGRAADHLPDFRFPHPPMGQAHRVEEAAAAAQRRGAPKCG